MDFLGSVRDYFFQLKNNIIEWFQSLRGTNAEISNDEMPPMQEQDGPARGTLSTSTLPSEENTLNEESKEEKL